MGAIKTPHIALFTFSTLLILVYLSFFTENEIPNKPIRLYRHRAYSENQTKLLLLVNDLGSSNSSEPMRVESTTKLEKKNVTSKPNASALVNTVVIAHTHPPSIDGVQMTYEAYVSGHLTPHTEICPDLGAHLRLAIFVTSAPNHAQARTAIRLTWGHYAKRKDIAFTFLLGSTLDAKLKQAIQQEDSLYNDIIIGNSLDTYSNLTLKTISMLEWLDNYCPKVPRILKTDDDMFINIPRLFDFLASHSKDKRKIYGRVVKKSPPKRLEKSKYYVSPKQYSGKVFPDFATGPAYLMTGDIVSELYNVALDEKYVRLEDVYLSGILATKLNIPRVNIPEFFNRRLSAHPCVVQKAISIHMVRYHEQFDLWKKLLDGRSKCGVNIKP